MKPSTKYIFVIDTEQYAGNFERDLCAWITGCVGECEVGEEYAKKVPPEVVAKFEDILEHRPDEHGVCRPCEIWETPGWYNDGKGNHFKGEGEYPAYLSVAIFLHKIPAMETLETMRRRANAFNEARKEIEEAWNNSPITITQFRLLEEKITIDPMSAWYPDTP